MRALKAFVVLGLGGFLMAGCGSSTTADGGTTGAATTGGATGAATTGGTTGAATTGGTTGTASTGGTTTGGTSLPAGSPCTSNGECSSDQCGIAGTGNCCSALCISGTACGASACDSSGACTYPPNTTPCGTATCSADMLTSSACDGSGSCAANTPAACPNHLACNSGGTACLTTCTMLSDCTTGFWCSAGTCMARLVTGACTENDACNSGVCGTHGTGNCCTTACSITDPTCGATACDGTGACTYPPNATACGTTCTGATLTSSACNGTGTCVANGGVPCPNNLGCNAAGTDCNASCVVNSDCVGTNVNFCDKSTSGCCPAIANPGTLLVDSTLGSDATACCGYGTAGACQTLTKAMHLVDGTNSLNPGTAVMLSATVNGGVGAQDWGNHESYPVSLGWGVTVYAPGVYFTDTFANEIFDVAVQTASGETAPGAMVTIQGFENANGTSSNPTVIGSDSSGNLTSDKSSIVVEANETLNVDAVNVYEAAGHTGIWVSDPSATLQLDFNGAGGAVSIGPLPPAGGLPNGTAVTSKMGTGILCSGTITDINSFAFPSSIASRGQDISIDAEGSCSVSLIWAPTFGWSTAGGYTGAGNGCTGNPSPMDNIGVQANGDATVSLGSAFNPVTISCMSTFGITATSPDGVNTPTVTLAEASIENCASAGIQVKAGTVVVMSGSIDHNFIGVDMESDGLDTPSVTLNDGTQTNNTTVICNSNAETGGADPGIDAYNNSSGILTADYVNWDQWYTPSGETTATTDLFWCSSTFTCTCQVLDSTSTAACVNTGTDDYDLVLGIGSGTSPTGTQTSSNGAQATGSCN